MPESVPDGLLLAEVVRAWYVSRESTANGTLEIRGLFEYIRDSAEPLAPGPILPLGAAAWMDLLELKTSTGLAAALVTNRAAMLLYHGLTGVDDGTLAWLQGHPAVLHSLLEDGAAAFSSTAPAVRVRREVVEVPGGAAATAAWEAVVGERTSRPESFITELMQRHHGRLAWLYDALAETDDAHLRYALAGGESGLRGLVRQAAAVAPEWIVEERPFWRPPFDLTLVLSLVEVGASNAPKGSDEFWRQVFRSDDLRKFSADAGRPLTAGKLIDLLFDEPFTARDRWEVFCLGQRADGVERGLPVAGLMLRFARRHPALAQMLDRIGIRDTALALALHRSSARISDDDRKGSDGALGPWQGALAIVERATLTGGFDRASAERALRELAALPLDHPRPELTAWFIDAFLARLVARPGAPQDAERAVMETMAGLLTPSGAARETRFTWEDLTYSFGAPRSLVARMEEAHLAQGTAPLADAVAAWRIAHGDSGDAEALARRLRDRAFPPDLEDLGRRLEEARKDRNAAALAREAGRAAEAIVTALLVALPYVPHLAASESPALGADVAFRHEFVASDESPAVQAIRPWLLARGHAQAGGGWHLQGSLLMLDLALADWYLRRNDEPAAAAPVFDGRDVVALAQVAALARSSGSREMGLEEAAAAVEQGRRKAEGAAVSELDELLARAGVDAWRRRALTLDATGPATVAASLTAAEAWRLAGAPGRLAPRVALDGTARFGAAPHSTKIMEGRRSAGLVGASAVDAQLRVALFLKTRGLPTELFGEVAAGVIADVIQRTQAQRPDNFVALADAVARLDDTRMDEHLLALVGDGTIGRPSDHHAERK